MYDPGKLYTYVLVQQSGFANSMVAKYSRVYEVPTCHVTVSIALANQEARSNGGNFEFKDRAGMWTSYCPLVIHFLPAGDSFLPAFF